MGPITTTLRRLFDDAVRGRNARFRRWNVPVYPNVQFREIAKETDEKIPL
jgi:hypothetical protein